MFFYLEKNVNLERVFFSAMQQTQEHPKPVFYSINFTHKSPRMEGDVELGIQD